MKKLFCIILFLVPTATFGQEMDTLTFYSPAFEEERTIYIKTPRSFKYKSDSVKLPVIYILDGQHEWFLNPLLSTIEYLQFTKEIPQALLVIIPHGNRTTESAFQSLDQDLPLHKFITEDIENNLEQYHLNDHRTIIGHSFTASFALYSYNKSPNFYSAAIANTPFITEELVLALDETPMVKDNIFISVGSGQPGKDKIHRNQFDEMNMKHPNFFNEIETFKGEYSAHNALPIVANPTLLTKSFLDFRSRLYHIAETEEEADINGFYNLKNEPEAIEKEIDKILLAARVSDYFYAPEIPELNGIASRYLSGDYTDHAIRIYEMGLNYYPKFWGFHLSLYNLVVEENPVKAKEYLFTAEEYLNSLDSQFPEFEAANEYIAKEKEKNGW